MICGGMPALPRPLLPRTFPPLSASGTVPPRTTLAVRRRMRPNRLLLSLRARRRSPSGRSSEPPGSSRGATNDKSVTFVGYCVTGPVDSGSSARLHWFHPTHAPREELYGALREPCRDFEGFSSPHRLLSS